MKKKKILHILYSGLGGHGNVFFSLVDADKKNEFEYAALFVGIEPVKEEYKIKCAERNIVFHYVKKTRRIDIPFFAKVKRQIKEAKPDTLFLHTPLTILPSFFYRLGRLRRVKIIIRETEPNHLKTKQDWLWLFTAMFCANKIVFLSDQFKNDVQKSLKLFFFKRKTAVIPNGIDLSLFKPAAKSVNRELTYLGMQSRLEKSKDHATLIKAFEIAQKKTNNLYLKIAGDGSKKPELQKLVQDINLCNFVEFTGLLKEDELVSFLQSLDIYIHASTGETMSTAIMQAMACGLPVIASDVKGINNMVVHQANGLLVQLGNADELADAISYLCSNENIRKEFGENNLKKASELYSNELMFSKYKQLINRL